MDNELINSIRQKYLSLKPFLNERSMRLWAAAEALELGLGGKVLVSQATELSRTTIYRGIRELKAPEKEIAVPVSRIRQKGGGRQRLFARRPEMTDRLKDLVECSTCGDPEGPLLWTCKSTRPLADALESMGFRIGRQKVSEWLSELGYSLQGNRKTKAGSSHQDRDRQFRFLSLRFEMVSKVQSAGYFSGHEKERTHRELFKQRPGVVS